MKSATKHVLCAALFWGLGSVSSPVPADNVGILQVSDGEQVYQQICQGCHMSDGQGASGAGHYPAIAGNPHMASAQFVAQTILHGRRNMPSFIESSAGGDDFWYRVTLSDEEIANVVNYVRSHFGNAYEDRLTVAEVKAMHP